MDKLPCSTSFLMSVNFDGLKEVIDFFHKNINLLNEKINDLNKRFKGFEEVRNQLNENKIKTESGLRLLNELDERINNYSINIMKNTEKSNSNEEKIKKLSDDIEKLQIINNNNSDSSNNSALNKIFEKYENLKEEIQEGNNINKDNINRLDKKIIELEQKLNSINSNNSEINNIINNINNKFNNNTNENINDEVKKNINNEEDLINKNYSEGKKNETISESIFYNNTNNNNKDYQLLSKRIENLEQNISKLYLKSQNYDDKNYNEIIPSNNTKTTVIKELTVNNEGNNNNKNNNFIELKNELDKKIDEFNDKMMKIEEDIRNIKLNNNNNYSSNINIPSFGKEERINETINNNENDNLNKEFNIELNENNNNNNKKEEKELNVDNDIKEEQKKDYENNDISVRKNIAEIMSQLNEINNKLSQDESLKKVEFNKYSQRIDIQLKDYNDKINKIIQKDNLRNKLLEDITRNNNYKPKVENINKIDKKTKNNNNYVTIDMLDSFESRNREMIIKYISNFDISSNPIILEINKNIEDSKNSIKELSFKLDEIVINNNKNKDFIYNLIDNLKKDIKNNIKKSENESEKINSLQEELDFFRLFLLGQEEDLKYKSMSPEEKKNELLIGTSIKEEMNIHNNYLKKLSEGINKVNNRINNLNKETLILIKKDLKAESNNIFDDFKSGLKESINRIETQLKDKVDKLGLDEFWNKINEQLIAEMKEKIDKKEMNKNNQYLKRKIDNLESKISRTLVDTLIDLQMDEAPLVIKRNFREIKDNKCASCGQNLPNINTGIMNNSSDFNNLGLNQYKIFKPKNIGDKDKLPDIKQTLPK